MYVTLGGSAAQGVGASSPRRGYVSLVAEQLSRSTGRPVRVINLSRSGARVRDVVDEQQPRLAGMPSRPHHRRRRRGRSRHQRNQS
ncbi:MAG: hypothetical protein ACYDC9_09005 [Dermatophilaceae bacterium]